MRPFPPYWSSVISTLSPTSTRILYMRIFTARNVRILSPISRVTRKSVFGRASSTVPITVSCCFLLSPIHIAISHILPETGAEVNISGHFLQSFWGNTIYRVMRPIWRLPSIISMFRKYEVSFPSLVSSFPFFGYLYLSPYKLVLLLLCSFILTH